jgi:hypothetical protein
MITRRAAMIVAAGCVGLVVAGTSFVLADRDTPALKPTASVLDRSPAPSAKALAAPSVTATSAPVTQAPSPTAAPTVTTPPSATTFDVSVTETLTFDAPGETLSIALPQTGTGDLTVTWDQTVPSQFILSGATDPDSSPATASVTSASEVDLTLVPAEGLTPIPFTVTVTVTGTLTIG